MNPIILLLLLRDKDWETFSKMTDVDIGWWLPISMIIGVVLGMALVWW